LNRLDPHHGQLWQQVLQLDGTRSQRATINTPEPQASSRDHRLRKSWKTQKNGVTPIMEECTCDQREHSHGI
ncbi:hypothetical protein ACWCZ5_34740, partial [Streptomyces sp. NPDC001667]